MDSSVNAVFVEDAGSLLKKGNSRNIEQVVSLPESINAPIRKGEELGKVDYILEGQTICSVPIVADEDVKQINLSNMMEFVFFNWFRLLR